VSELRSGVIFDDSEKRKKEVLWTKMALQGLIIVAQKGQVQGLGLVE